MKLRPKTSALASQRHTTKELSTMVISYKKMYAMANKHYREINFLQVFKSQKKLPGHIVESSSLQTVKT